MKKEQNSDLVPRSPDSLEKSAPGRKRILTEMVADTLGLADRSALAPSAHVETAEVEKWLQQGKDHYFGNGVTRSYRQAYRFFHKAAVAGNAEAQFHVAVCLEDGDGIKQDQVEAVAWYLKSANAGYAKAQNNLAICYRDEDGAPRDYDEAEQWYSKAAEQGYAPSSCREPRDPAQPSSMQRMGYYYSYRFDHGSPHDAAEAVRWFLREAERGNADAQCNLGWCYEFGHGVPRDMATAAGWYRAAAEEWHFGALNKLVVGIQCGWITATDDDERWKWYVRMDGWACLIRWLRKGAERGEAMDQFFLGVMCERGKGVRKDLAEAYKWLRLAEEQNLTRSRVSREHPEKLPSLTTLKSSMTPDQIKEGERRVAAYKPIL